MDYRNSMTNLWIYVIACLISIIFSEAAPNTRFISEQSKRAVEPKSSGEYSFRYDVDDPSYSNFFGHSERRIGHRTEGEYYVRLPDNQLQRVVYYADETGYHPQITYFPFESERVKQTSSTLAVPLKTPSQEPPHRFTSPTRNTPPEFMLPSRRRMPSKVAKPNFASHENFQFGQKTMKRKKQQNSFNGFQKQIKQRSQTRLVSNRPASLSSQSKPQGPSFLNAPNKANHPLPRKPSPSSFGRMKQDTSTHHRRIPSHFQPNFNHNRREPLKASNIKTPYSRIRPHIPSFVKGKSLSLNNLKTSSSSELKQASSSEYFNPGKSLFNPKVYSASFLSSSTNGPRVPLKTVLGSSKRTNKLFTPIDPNASVVPSFVPVIIPVEGYDYDDEAFGNRYTELEDYIDDNYL